MEKRYQKIYEIQKTLFNIGFSDTYFKTTYCEQPANSE